MSELFHQFYNIIENTPLFFLALIVLFITKNIDFSERLKIVTIYLFSLTLYLTKMIKIEWLTVLILISSFLTIEIFTNDKHKQTLFNLPEKLADYIYKILFEYELLLVLLSVVLFRIDKILYVLNLAIFASSILSVICFVLSGILLLYACFAILSERYELNTITETYDILFRQTNSTLSNKMKNKYYMLCALEDSGFTTRSNKRHTIFTIRNFGEALKRISLNTIKHPISTLKMIWRGYSTIEMQLLRTIGLKHGYSCEFKRKIYEILYSRLILNSIQRAIVRDGLPIVNFKYWIFLNYINNVRVKIGGIIYVPIKNESTSIQIFNKDFDKLTKEEFFIWCIGLTGINQIGPNAINARDSYIEKFNLDKRGIYKILNRIQSH